MNDEEYEDALRDLQIELGRLQQSVRESKRRVAIIFEGRDAAGKGGGIRRFTENLSPREHRIVALTKPTETEQGQWYFQRYISQLPNAGEMVFFDRSWYNRAVVEPVMGFCTAAQHKHFMNTVGDFESLITQDGIEVVKLWFAITKGEQKQRFHDRESDPLRQWKTSPIDKQAQAKWADFTKYASKMISTTSFSYAPWAVVRTDKKRIARLESIRCMLNALTYPKRPSKRSTLLAQDNKVVTTIAQGADPGAV